MFNFVFDRRDGFRPFPNLAPVMPDTDQSYHNMGNDWPFITPCRLLYFFQDHGYPCNISYTDQPIPAQAWYPVGLGFFHFDLDYFGMMSEHVLDLVRSGALRVLFYYHEGDSPYHEKHRLDSLCQSHNLPTDCYRFVSGNTKADSIKGFCWFADHELFYWRNSVRWNNKSMPGMNYHTRRRLKRYTALNRTHKWWRATVMTELRDSGLLENSYWSYNKVDQSDQWIDNPINLYRTNNLKQRLKTFFEQSPFTCDHLDSDEHNSHWLFVPEHYDNSYCHLIMETLYDAEQSGGVFLSEKTFKPIRHAQPFMLFGTANSLLTLRKLGYQTFDNQIDNSYDHEQDNTERFLKTLNSLRKLNQSDLHEFYISCRDQILHNQELFLGSKYDRLQTLHEKLNND